MERIVIIGCPGSGKSTLARELGEILNLTVVHLDRLWWTKGWENVSMEEFDARLNNALKLDSWIIDGNYSRTMDARPRNATPLSTWTTAGGHACGACSSGSF